MIIATIPALVCLAGLLMYVLAGTGSPPTSNAGKVAELGRIMFFAGLLVALLALGSAGAIRVP